MNKVELIDKIAEHVGIDKKEVGKVLDGFEEVVISSLQAGQEVTLTGFGTFSAKFRSARGGVNPQKPSERIRIPAVTVPKFKAGKTLKDALKAKSSFMGTESVSQEPERAEYSVHEEKAPEAVSDEPFVGADQDKEQTF